jgi:hypothetical protein
MKGSRDERGMALIIVMTLIAVLAFAASAMAMAVEANLHALTVVGRLDRIHYAAESAVARGAAAAISSEECPGHGSVNGTAITIACQAPVQDISADGIKRWAIPAQPLSSSACLSVPLVSLIPAPALWTVLGWRGPASAGVSLWVDHSSGCTAPNALVCGKRTVNASPAYVVCANGDWDESDGQPTLHVAAAGAPVLLGSFVIRLAHKGPDAVATVLGQANSEVDEADVLLPNHGQPAVGVWHTVLP